LPATPGERRTDPDAQLRVADLTKRYGRLTALDSVSFSVRPGEVLGVIGPNGSGKTTLFACLGGLLPFESGRIAQASAGPRHDFLFYLPDAIAPWPAQRVRWALEFIASYFGSSAAPDAVAKELGLEALRAARIGELSKGQRKRFLIALGLLTPQPLLLLDEPFDGLDLRQSREAAAALRRCAAAGRTLVLSIHQIADAARVCDRFVLLSGGRVAGEGTVGELSALAAVRSGAAPADLEEAFLALT
jgi:ABC-2 type transport system ATP-binding protein